MYQAITTKYFGPTNTRGSRIKASCDARTRWTNWDYSLNTEKNHTAAARALAEELGWNGNWWGGGTSEGYCFVLAWSRYDMFVVPIAKVA